MIADEFHSPRQPAHAAVIVVIVVHRGKWTFIALAHVPITVGQTDNCRFWLAQVFAQYIQICGVVVVVVIHADARNAVAVVIVAL